MQRRVGEEEDRNREASSRKLLRSEGVVGRSSQPKYLFSDHS